MKKHLQRNKFLIISLMLFSMFFGAGNFIFPTQLGKEAGENVYSAILAFGLTAVALPILGIAAVAKSGSMKALVNRVDPFFGAIFTILIYIVIGPAFAIPRAANMPFEVSVVPFLSESSKFLWLCIYSFIYFAINYAICINKSTMIDTLGKYLTPVMLILLVVLYLAGIFAPIGEFAPATKAYITHPITEGFLQGYQTMDALASIVFAIVVINAIKNLGISDERILVNSTIKSGILAGVILMLIYIMLAYLGASSSAVFAEASNGAILLSNITFELFGNFGRFILGAIFILACLTTTVGLIGSASEFFSSFTPKISYKMWCVIWSFLSFCVATIGLEAIINKSIPVLYALYPVTIILIILGLLNSFIDSSKLIYRSCVYLAAIIGVVNSLDITCQISIPFLTDLLKSLPFYDQSLGWIVPEISCFLITYVIFILSKKSI